MRPKVLVLLAAFNGSDWIVEQIESILGQEGVDLSLLIGDDGSTDGTLAKLEGYASKTIYGTWRSSLGRAQRWPSAKHPGIRVP
jgi:glycosyltransferase involved in cell wall biosynthesis